MNEFPLLDAAFLRTAGRNVSTPFRIQFIQNGYQSELVCNEVLRLLPGKRLAAEGTFNSSAALVKIFFHPPSVNRHDHL